MTSHQEIKGLGVDGVNFKTIFHTSKFACATLQHVDDQKLDVQPCISVAFLESIAFKQSLNPGLATLGTHTHVPIGLFFLTPEFLASGVVILIFIETADEKHTADVPSATIGNSDFEV